MIRTFFALALTATPALAATTIASNQLGGPFPIVNEGWGNGPIPDNGTTHVDGTWQSPYCRDAHPTGNIAQANVTWTESQNHILRGTVHAGICEAAEWASDAGWSFNGGASFPYGQTGYGYGFYEVVMKTGYGDADGVHGTVQSFFIRGAEGTSGNLQDPEIDFEFLTNESWDTPNSTTGKVHLSATGISGDAISEAFDLPFNPSAKFHHYAFNWQPGTVTFYVDGKPFTSYQLPDLTNPQYGMIIMGNVWDGIASWGGLPPLEDQSALYARWVYRTAP